MTKLILLHPANADRSDAIRDYAVHVVRQLQSEGRDATLLRPRLGRGLGADVVNALPRRGRVALLVQYNPFSWGRWGVAPHLVWALILVRLRRPKVRVVLTIHEAYVPMKNLRWLLMGAWQRVQVRALLAVAHGAVATAGYLAAELSRGWPRCSISHVPVGSNLPDERSSREAARRAAGYEGQLVIATFSGGHPSHLHALVSTAVEAAAGASPNPVVLLLLGSGDVPPAVRSSVERVDIPGYLDESVLAQALSAADLFLAPYEDGATTHRTTLMAALQHGVAVVTTVTRRTELVLREDQAMPFAAPDDSDGFAAKAVNMAMDSRRREQQAAACRRLYERHFAWPVICAGLWEAAAC